jgi:hypothetical protein
MTAEEYLELVSDWEDPYPTPVIEKHNNYFVLRDDLLEGGSKIRFLDFLIQSKTDVEEWVYGSSPAGGYGQISISFLCKKYGKQAVIVAPERKKTLKFQQKNDREKTKLAKSLGFKIYRIPYWLEENEERTEIINILNAKPSFPDIPMMKHGETHPKPTPSSPVRTPH